MRLWHAGAEGGEDRTADVRARFDDEDGTTFYIDGGGIAEGDYLLTGPTDGPQALGVVENVSGVDATHQGVRTHFWPF